MADKPKTEQPQSGKTSSMSVADFIKDPVAAFAKVTAGERLELTDKHGSKSVVMYPGTIGDYGLTDQYPQIDMESELPVDLMSHWLKTPITGCAFAVAIANKQTNASVRLVTARLDLGELPGYVHATLVAAATAHTAILFIFPSLRYDEEIADLLTALTTIPAFKIYKKDWPPGVNRHEVLVLLEWETPSGHFSRTMGFAPSGAMPVTRRAPFVSLLVWPGGHENHLRPENHRQVGVVDMNHDFKESVYDNAWEKSMEHKKQRDAEEPDGSASLRYVTFCLHDRVSKKLTFSTR